MSFNLYYICYIQKLMQFIALKGGGGGGGGAGGWHLALKGYLSYNCRKRSQSLLAVLFLVQHDVCSVTYGPV